MTADNLLDLIGVSPDEYREACRQATEAAPFFLEFGSSVTFVSDIPHTIASWIWKQEWASPIDKLEMTFEFFEQMPCYGLLLYITFAYDDLPPDARGVVWARYRHYLETDDLLAGPVVYSLGMDHFNDRRRIAAAWSAMAAEPDHEGRLRRILEIAGDVPFAWKERLYHRLLANERWHHLAELGLWEDGCWDLFGHCSGARASRLLARLDQQRTAKSPRCEASDTEAKP